MTDLTMMFYILTIGVFSHTASSAPITSIAPCSDTNQLKQVFITDNVNIFSSKDLTKNCIPKIPQDYTSIDGFGAYKFHSERKNWNDARNTCIKEGGHLVILNCKEEEAAVRKLTLFNANTFIGVHDIFAQNDWTTVLDQPLSSIGYSNWAPSQPDNASGSQHCVRLETNKWDDIQCKKFTNFYLRNKFINSIECIQ